MAAVRKIKCTVQEILDHGSQVYSLLLSPEKRLPRFRPGHFLHLALDPYDPSGFWPDSRVFSIASSPASRDVLRITYSVKGRFTQRMEQELYEGCEVWVKLPYGDFLVEGDDVVLIAGGTGMTAFSAYLAERDGGMSGNVSVVYGARNDGLLVYKETVLDAICRGACQRLFLFLEEGSFEDAEVPEVVQFRQGIIDLPEVLKKFADIEKKQFYIAGPPVMIDSIKHVLRDHSVCDDQVHVDAWE